MAAAGRVGQHELGAPSMCSTDGVVNHGARIGTLGPANNVGPGPFGPHRELVGGGGPEGVSGSEDDGASGRHLS